MVPAPSAPPPSARPFILPTEARLRDAPARVAIAPLPRRATRPAPPPRPAGALPPALALPPRRAAALLLRPGLPLHIVPPSPPARLARSLVAPSPPAPDAPPVAPRGPAPPQGPPPPG